MIYNRKLDWKFSLGKICSTLVLREESGSITIACVGPRLTFHDSQPQNSVLALSLKEDGQRESSWEPTVSQLPHVWETVEGCGHLVTADRGIIIIWIWRASHPYHALPHVLTIKAAATFDLSRPYQHRNRSIWLTQGEVPEGVMICLEN